MWTIKEVKGEAIKFLKNNYLISLAVCIIVDIFNELTIVGDRGSGVKDKFFNINNINRIGLFDNIIVNRSILINITIIGVLAYIIIKFFIHNPLEIGKSTFFLKGLKGGDIKIKDLFSVFKEKDYINIVKIQFLRYIYIGLWSLLFIIPGIIKSYEYFMIPYILAENPSMDRVEAFKLSKELTEGEKMNIFLLDLSFLGWQILGALLFIVGIYLVDPYIEASYADLYIRLSNKIEVEM